MKYVLGAVKTGGCGSADGLPASILNGNWFGFVSVKAISKSSGEGKNRIVIQLQR